MEGRAGDNEVTRRPDDARSLPARKQHLILTRGQFVVWYAGGYRSAASAALAGVDGDPASIARLLMATGDREPWLADYF